jgi:hypothetical protein
MVMTNSSSVRMTISTASSPIGRWLARLVVHNNFPNEVRNTFETNLPQTWAVSTGRCNTGLQFTRRGLKAQGLSGALVETQRDLVEMGLSVDGQVGLLREGQSARFRLLA